MIAGTVPTKGTVKRARNSASASVDAVLQATTTRSGACARWLADDGDDAPEQLGLRQVAIREAGVVGDIDEARVGARSRDLAEDGQAAEAGVEDEDGGGAGCGHGRAKTRAACA